MPRAVLPIIFILGSILGFIFFINPQYALVKEKREEATKVSDAVKKADQLRVLRDNLAVKRNGISNQDLDRINKMLPDGVENIGLIIEMNNVAKDMGLELLNPTIGNIQGATGATNASTVNAGGATANGGLDIGPDSKKYGQLSMSFSVNTTYEKFNEYLKELERSLRLVDITDVRFGQLDAKTGKTNFSVTIQTYWLK